MKFYGKAECAAKQIVQAFESGHLPQALAPIFVHRRDNVPQASWSWHNQLLCVLAGCADARGYRQWEESGRHVTQRRACPDADSGPLHPDRNDHG